MNRNLSIAVVAPPWFTVPPSGYGGIEAVCADLVDGLVARGHRVALIAAGKSETKATEQHSSFESPQSLRINETIVDAYHTALADSVISGGKFDIVHDHTLAGPLLGRSRNIPTVSTIHSNLKGDYLAYFREMSKWVALVALSRGHQAASPDVTWTDYVYNGIRTADFPFRDRAEKEDWVLFLGRSTRAKGMDVAIDAARAAGRRIVLAAKCNEPPEKRYFEEHVRPRLGSDTEWLGEVGGAEKGELLAKAACLVNPISWEEPFGLVMAEAMACGTPVVTYARGAAPEVVEHGVTGYVNTSFDDLVASIDAADSLSPKACRTRAVENFDMSVMVEKYERLYLRLLDS
ncbi:glycosyltransferase family 4 protein [Streptomyces sp. NPDC056835]|uniref:glycosyltransferase family 4 protein n=1 Tax=Streptomyces sp. NPDC056835 TaxID=3345956 RepID=UPI0036A1B671